ncbi:predicted protein [Streptomyces viridosporus ATCC 14672]|uniref:Predicted protein n=1 Tax=Streptomyces viridosporus (strain ATCC 14672 / DSM 40746 / JCM 4963 / KCTC 9882 / NRRL B-12104 / FH 1290) TaxID=566461 RepID=D5ZVK1_STRV1|nr:predicted protein [Streptomyces viridosporus ATCC 14672]
MWLCFRFPLGFREVEELLPQHGVVVPCEAVVSFPSYRRCATARRRSSAP